ncbi:MAG: diheme cytochrome c, partial [Usitatibacteraceae bacterium]
GIVMNHGTSTQHPRFCASLLATLCLLPFIATPAFAESGKRALQVPLLPKFQQECSSCHTAYPPGMLPAASWIRVMKNLNNHYGTDASIDQVSVNEITAWLSANAGTYKRVSEEPFQDRITRAEWFIRKHREVPAATWKRPAIKSAANCAACHPQADKGDFNEHSIRIPR